MNAVLTLHQGTAPLLISLPHDGTQVPDDIGSRFTPAARQVPDTDWHIAKLYAFAREIGASFLVPSYSRYVIDLNRPEDDRSLYPGQNTTGLCPIVCFSGEKVYQEGQQPTDGEIRQRVEKYWRPYHQALRGELTRIKSIHGRVVLWEAHSIKGELPFLFQGRLPDLNLGTANGYSCSAALQARLHTALADQYEYDYAVNGRFQGGYITRHYGDPANAIDAVQLEISQRNYMDEVSFNYHYAQAAKLQALIRILLETAIRND